MNNSLQLFSYNSQNVRTILRGQEPWFVIADVCRVLGIKNVGNAVARLHEDDIHTADVIDSVGRTQKTRTTNESGVYELVFQSRKPEAKAFMRWITSEVLPAIRKTGSYGTPAPTMDLSTISRRELAQAIIAEADRADAAERKLEIAAPKVEAFETFMEADNDYDCRDAAQLLTNAHGIEIGRNRLFDWLEDHDWIGRDRRPKQTKLEQGLLTLKFSTYVVRYHRDGTPEFGDPQVRITPKGLEKIRRTFMQDEPVRAAIAAPKRKRRTLNP